MKTPANRNPLRQILQVSACFASIPAIGIIDAYTGYEVTLALLYVLPIFTLSWISTRKLAIAAALLSAAAWIATDISSGRQYSHPYSPAANAILKLFFYLAIAALSSSLRASVAREFELARTDFLTGALNRRFFYDLVQMEMTRSRRSSRPMTMVYIDLDNFKFVNDRYGHSVGDKVLRSITDRAHGSLRDTDILCRSGGDEFVALLPETDLESSRVVVTKLRDELLDEMQANNWPITFSIGVLTRNPGSPLSVEDMIVMADKLMYSVKHSGKNSIAYAGMG